MFCPHCHNKIPDGSNICPLCYANLAGVKPERSEAKDGEERQPRPEQRSAPRKSGKTAYAKGSRQSRRSQDRTPMIIAIGLILILVLIIAKIVRSMFTAGTPATINTPQPQPQQQAEEGWTCSCGMTGYTGKFCMECGGAKPEEPAGWTCSCGTLNQGKFCMNCGAKKPEGALLYRCDKCGWEPEDPTHPPKFCPECGDIFDENDRQ